MSSNPHIEYATVTTGLRAPRVAVVFPACRDWAYFARAAVYAMSSVWGGAGFVLVPAADDGIAPSVRDAVIAYDPDYVLSFAYAVGDLDNLTPGTIEQILDNQDISDDDTRAQARDHLRVQPVNDEVLDRGRRELVTACSSYRIEYRSESGDSEHRWHERELTLSAPAPTAPGHLGALTPMERIRIPSDPAPIGLSPNLAGDIGVAAATRLGLLSPPNAVGPGLDSQRRSAVLQWLIRASTRFPVATPEIVLDPAHGTAHGLPTAWDATTTGLVPAVNASGRRAGRLCVIGGSANDFALAMIWDRLYGSALWIPDSWLDGEHREEVLQIVRDNLIRPHSGERAWVLTSISHDTEVVEAIRDEILGLPSCVWVGEPTSVGPDDLPVVGSGGLQYPASGKRHLGVDEQYSSVTTMPVVRDPDGSTTLAATPPLTIILHGRLERVPDLSWQVDIDIPDTPIPPTRHVPSRAILHPDESPHTTWLRASRNGLSYEALSYGFVPAGASVDYRLSKPRIKKPGIREWADARAALNGRAASTSPAGKHGDVLQTMFGSRTRLIEVVSGGLLPVLRSFIPQASTSRDQFPNGEGCVVRGGVYLNFPGMVSISGISAESARSQCDQLLAERILARGLLLDCSFCGNLDFVMIDRLGQINECVRCGQSNDLSLSRWRMPADEPQWFYDLHPVATALMSQNGEVPILLAAHLRSRAAHGNRYADCAEIQLTDSTGRNLAEADLLALVDDRVVVAEAKSTDELDKGANQRKAASKRVLLAETFGADEILLATTKEGWKETSIAALHNAVEKYDWKTMRRPRIRTVTGLGTDAVHDRYVDRL